MSNCKLYLFHLNVLRKPRSTITKEFLVLISKTIPSSGPERIHPKSIMKADCQSGPAPRKGHVVCIIIEEATYGTCDRFGLVQKKPERKVIVGVKWLAQTSPTCGCLPVQVFAMFYCHFHPLAAFVMGFKSQECSEVLVVF